MKADSTAYYRLAAVALFALAVLAASGRASSQPPGTAAVKTIPGMPPVSNPLNLYSDAGAGRFSPAVQGQLARVYVPNLRSNDVYVLDPETAKVLYKIKVGRSPQHVVPSWDLQTLWVANNAEGRRDGSLTPVDPRTGLPGAPAPVDDPYNMYFTPDGRSAIVVAEAQKRLDFRDPHTMQLQYSIQTPECGGINHADFAIDGSYALFTCEFNGSVAKIDLASHSVVAYLPLRMPQMRFKEGSSLLAPTLEVSRQTRGMPQDIRISPDGRRFYVADMDADGVHVIDAGSFTEVGFIQTGLGTHGLYPSRDGRLLYVANRGTHRIHGRRHGPGSVSVIDFATEKVVANWGIPEGGSPDMGGVSADGRFLWLSGRFDDEVYRIDTSDGAVTRIKVGQEPHGLAVWPQPGRYSLGHTGNMR